MSRQGGGSDESKGGDAEPVVRTLGPKDSPIVSVTVYTEAVAEVSSARRGWLASCCWIG